MKEHHKKVNPVVFFNYYETYGWKDPHRGRSIVQIWRKVVDLWDARQRQHDEEIKEAQNGPKYMENEYNFASMDERAKKDLEEFLSDD